MKSLRKMLALLLCLCLFAGLVPAAWAERNEIPVSEEVGGLTTTEIKENDENSNEVENSRKGYIHVIFDCNPQETEIIVYDLNIGEVWDDNVVFKPSIITAEADGSFVLYPGRYMYDAVCDGYYNICGENFDLSAGDINEDYVIHVNLTFDLGLERSETFLAGEGVTKIDAPPYPNVNTSYTTSTPCGTVRFISQISSSQYFYSSYWGSWASQAGIECGTASISMALSYVGVNKTPNDILTPYSGTTYFCPPSGSWGGTQYLTPSFTTAMNDYLNGNGKYSPPIIHFPNGTLTSAGHYAVVIGKISSNQFYIADPAYNIGTITINGNNWNYKGASGSIDQVRQYYNANATPWHAITVKATVDGDYKDNLIGVGAFDVYINGSLDASNVSEYNKSWPAGTQYEIRNIRGFGYEYYPAPASGVTGALQNSNIEVRLIFNVIPQYYTVATSRTDYNNGHRYERYDYHLTWTEAKQFCENKGGHLATITSEQEQAIIEDLLSGCPFGVYYLGGTDMNQSGNWSWITGEAFTYQHWDPQYEPSKGDAEYYTAIIGIDNPPNKQFGEWLDIPNNRSGDFYAVSNSGFICEYEKEPYTVTYDANGGTDAPDSQVKREGIVLTLSSDEPTRERSNSGIYTITFDANGGSVSPTSMSVDRTINYIFTCWNTEADGSGTSYFPGDPYVVDEDVTLYAQWRVAPATTAVNLLTPTRDNYVCLGWATERTAREALYRAGESFTPEGNTTLYAVWAQGTLSEWSETMPADVDESLIETKTQYRYRDKETTTSEEASMNGWRLETTEQSWSDFGPWSEWSSNVINADDFTTVETRTAYGWYYFECPNCHAHMHGYGTCWTWCGGCGATTTVDGWHQLYDGTNWNVAQEWHGTGKYTTIINGERWFRWNEGGTQTQYRYRTRTLETTYTFYRWTDWSPWIDTEVAANDTREIEIRTLYRYLIRDYTVSYDANGGTGAPDPQIIETGTNFILSSVIPERSDQTESYLVTLNANGGSVSPQRVSAMKVTSYSFDGWNTSKDGSGTAYVPGGVNKTEADLNLYAQWNVTEENAEASLPTPTRDDYIFRGWAESADATEGVTGYYMPEKNVTLYAIWEIKTFTVTYDANGGENAPEPQEKIPGTALIITSDVPTHAFWFFLGWAESADATTAAYQPGDSFTKDADTTLYAVWLKPDFVLPDALTEIGEEAFANCGFTYVKLPENTDTIGKNAFANCPNLKYIYIPKNCLWIDRYAFTGVTGLTILGVDGSYAQTYASGKGFDFIAVP